MQVNQIKTGYSMKKSFDENWYSKYFKSEIDICWNRLRNNDNLLQHPREKIDPLIGIQDFVPKESCFTPDNRKNFENLEKSS